MPPVRTHADMASQRRGDAVHDAAQPYNVRVRAVFTAADDLALLSGSFRRDWERPTPTPDATVTHTPNQTQSTPPVAVAPIVPIIPTENAAAVNTPGISDAAHIPSAVDLVDFSDASEFINMPDTSQVVEVPGAADIVDIFGASEFVDIPATAGITYTEAQGSPRALEQEQAQPFFPTFDDQSFLDWTNLGPLPEFSAMPTMPTSFNMGSLYPINPLTPSFMPANFQQLIDFNLAGPLGHVGVTQSNSSVVPTPRGANLPGSTPRPIRANDQSTSNEDIYQLLDFDAADATWEKLQSSLDQDPFDLSGFDGHDSHVTTG